MHAQLLPGLILVEKRNVIMTSPLHVKGEVYRSTTCRKVINLGKLLILPLCLYCESVSSDNGDLYCKSHAEYIERSVSDMLHTGGEQEDLVIINVFTVDEVCREISRLKLSKKGGYHGLTNEHLKFGGSQLALCLTNLFNGIYRVGVAPLAMKRGLICILFKGSRKYDDDRKN